MTNTGVIRLGTVAASLGAAGVGLVAAASPELLLNSAEHAVRLLRGLGAAGGALFAVAQVLVAVSGVLPASLLGVAAGALYGMPAGAALSAASMLGGAVLSFALTRSVFRPAVSKYLERRTRLRALDHALGQDGWRVACLLRVSPVMPFALTSYALGLSSIRLRDYLLGTLAAMPALLGYVLLGALAGSGVAAWSSSSTFGRWSLALGMLATVVLTLRVGQLVARVLRADPASAARPPP